ncbi:hypothetical protein M0813_07432 [Anaeramoeba flamelloides]|uniref:B box-type domain-containing protein n=1 Tax=Anaeramoeba flamelloides TaxID=1746091 RepID=A0ABQ8XEW4_9EUKA|nr:hypothetical protein M0813_07432 [Anaeramoeba flamelloides]
MTTYFPIQATKENQKEEAIIWCDCCLNEENKKVVAKVYCQDCDENQCEECDSMHKNKKFKSHVRTDPQTNNSSSEKCPIHQNSKLTRYCKNCQKLICDKCVFEHSNHETISFNQSMDFYKELIKEQKKSTQNHCKRINEKFEQLNNSEKQMNVTKENILKTISKFYLNQKKLLDLLEKNEKKLANDFFDQISTITKKEKQTINNSKCSTEKLLNQFLELETNITQSNSYEFFKLFSQMQFTNNNEDNQILQISKLCKKHKDQPFKYFCLDHKQLLCVDCAILNHNNCQKSNNFKEGYEKIKIELEILTKKINSINENKKGFLQHIQNEKFNTLKEKQINLDMVKKNYQKLNELTQQQFKKMNGEISNQQNGKYLQLNKQSKEIQKGIDNVEKSKMIIKEIEIYKKYDDYQEILHNYFKLKKLFPILNKINNDNNQLICNSKFGKINLVSNNLKNWKYFNLTFDLNKTKIEVPSRIQLKKKLQFSIILKNQLNETINAKEFDLKASIINKNINKIITEITKFREGINQESIGEYIFQEEGEYNIIFSINDQIYPKSPFNVKVIDKIFLEESEILEQENNPKFNQILGKWVKESGCNSNLKRRFNSKTDGWEPQTFHQKCDNKGKSIVLIKLNNNSLFGGFAAIDWDSTTDNYKQSEGNKSFLFSLISLDTKFKEPLKMDIYPYKKNEIYCDPKYGPTFGDGWDLILGYGSLYNNYNMNNNLWTYSNLGGSYKPPFRYPNGSDQARDFLAGSSNYWDIYQLEIFCEK